MKSIRFAIKMFFLQMKKSVLSVLLMSISMFLLMFTVMIYVGENYTFISCDTSLKRNIANTGVLQLDLDDIDAESVLKFLEEAYNRKEIFCIGNTVDYGTRDPSGGVLLAQQEGHALDYQITLEGLLEAKYMHSYAMNLCELKIEESLSIEELDVSQSDISYIYLGAGYEEIAVGTEYVDEHKQRYVVAGKLAEGQRFINNSLLDGYNTEILDYTGDCTYAVIVINDHQLYSNGCWISAAEGYTIEQAIDAAKETGKNYGITFTYETIDTMYKVASRDIQALLSYLWEVLMIVLASTLLMLVTIQIVTMLEEAKEYGIMYAVGFSKTEITGILLWKHVLTTLAALVVSGGACIYTAVLWFANEDIAYMLKTILGQYVFPAAVMFALVIVVVSYIITNVILSKFTPVKLMKSKFYEGEGVE